MNRMGANELKEKNWRKSTGQYRPSLVPKESRTYPILPPKGLQSLLSLLSAPPRVSAENNETMHLHLAQSNLTTQYSSSDPALRLYAAHKLALSPPRY